jgi:hypothetical protein
MSGFTLRGTLSLEECTIERQPTERQMTERPRLNVKMTGSQKTERPRLDVKLSGTKLEFLRNLSVS